MVRRKRLFSWLIIVAVIVLSSAGVVAAQTGSPIVAQVDRQLLTTDEFLTLTIILDASAGQIPPATIPTLDGFNIVSTGQATQINIINGAMTQQAVYTYYVQPTRTGDLVIPPFTVTINGQTYATDPIPIQVTQGLVQPNSNIVPGGLPLDLDNSADGNQLYVEADVDNDSPFVGEQLLYHFRFFQGVRIFGQPDYTAPNFTGFWNNAQPQQNDYLTNVSSTQYRVTELTNVLFPTAGGELTIEPARLNIASNFFDPGEAMETNPVVVNVRPLPDGAPADFGGAVGQYVIEAAVDTTQITTSNSSVNLRVMINGMGNVDALPDPALPDLPGWRVFPEGSDTAGSFQNGIYGGTRTFDYSLVPTEEGALTIPPITYTYFDPELEQYTTTTSDPIIVNVAPGAAEQPAAQPQQVAPAAATPVPTPQPEAAAPEAEATGLRALKPAADTVESSAQPLTSQPAFWALWILPLALIIADVFWRRRERYLRENETLVRSSRALKNARKALSHARKRKADAYAAAPTILTGYISDKVQQPVGGLTRNALTRLLESRGVKPELVQRVDRCLTTSEFARYSPARDTGTARSVLDETERVITQLEKEFAV